MLKTLLRQHLLLIIILVLTSLTAVKALNHPGLYTAHDIWHQVARLYHYTQSLSEGNFPPAWISQLANGFGYPLFLFSYHLPWLIGSPLVIAGLPIQTTIKVLFALCAVGSALSMYTLIFSITRQRLAAFLSAFIYVWAPYQFLTTFVSAAIGTSFQLVIGPIMLLGLYWTITSRPRLGILTTALSVLLSILAHLITFVYLGIFAGIFTFVLILLLKPKSILKKLALVSIGVSLGLLLSGPYTLPILSYKDQIQASTSSGGFSDITNSNFINFSQLLYSKWGFGPIISNAKDGEISFQLGISQWISVAVALIVYISSFRKKLKKHQRIIKNVMSALGIVLILSILGMLDLSKPIWKILISYLPLDYPFRLLIISLLSSSILAGLTISIIKIRWIKLLLVVSLCSVAVYTNRNHMRVNQYTDIPTSLYVQSETTTNTFHEYLPSSADPSLLNGDQPPIINSPTDLQADIINKNTTTTEFNIDVENKTEIVINEFNFPGQRLYINDSITNLSTDPQGRISFIAPAGKSQVVRVYEQTPAVQSGFIASLFGLLLCFQILLPRRKVAK